MKVSQHNSEPVVIGGWSVSYMSEQFRIFPKNKAGQTIPIRRVNYFLTLKHTRNTDEIVFKRYLHRGLWYWRDSREKASQYEDEIVKEIARHLFKGDRVKAENLIISMLMGLPLATS